MLHKIRMFIWLLLPLLSCRADDYQDAYNDDEFYHSFETCANSVVQVTSIEVLCNSPQTYYYGNGVNRNSPTCDYGDKATITVNFDVSEDLEDGVDIYMVIAAYTEDGEALYQSNTKTLCDNYVGDECSYQGSYAFSTQVQFEYVDYGDEANFVPVIQMAFSSYADGGTNLGGANIDECYEDSDEDGGQYFDYWESTEKEESQGAGNFIQRWGVLLGVTVAVVAFVVILWRKNGGSLEQEGRICIDDDSSNSFELM